MFFAVLIAGLALSIGIAIYDLVVRELSISATTVQSQQAIDVADSGSECALYWDSKYPGGGFFATSTPAPSIPANTGVCNGYDIAHDGTVVTSASSATTTFYISFGGVPASSPCVKVQVAKYLDTSLSPQGVERTEIISDGYNFGDVTQECQGPTGEPGQVNRELLVTY